ncbi:MAG: hypothetical protein V4598_06825 [Bdellovibrionota bacterium]
MRVLAVIFALSSFSAIAACPNLAGTYAVCRSTTGSISTSTELIVTQATTGGVTTYSFSSIDDETHERDADEMIADGKTRSETAQDPNYGEVKVSITYKCSGNSLVGNENILMEGQHFLDINHETTKSGNTITRKFTGTVIGYPVEDTLICE